MKIKSSGSNPLMAIGVCVLMILALVAFRSLDKKKVEVIEVPSIERKTTLNSLQITVREKHYRKLKEKRNEALADGILETDDNDYVPGIITFDGKDYDAELRLKGDWTDHLQDDKWSYRIKLKNDQTIMGMRKFSVHHPKTRGYVNEWLYHKANKAEDLIGLRYQFAEGFLHIKLKNPEDSIEFINKNVGIYAIEETFDKRTIESNRRKEGVILRISEQYFWKETKQAWKIANQTGSRANPKRIPKFIGPRNEYVSTFGLSKILADKALNKQFKHAKNLLETYRLGRLKPSEVFDTKKLALHTAINNLFGAYHGLEAINLRFYYNPTTSKLEPIAYDGNSGERLKEFHHYLYTNKEIDIEYTKELIAALELVSHPEYLKILFDNFYKEAKGFDAILQREFGKHIVIDKNVYAHNQTILRQEAQRLKILIQSDI
ncbi:hypothetical protein QQ020_26545 [Fulvivirgaceae bacterium BMA12]|uniref:Uncharacterized protein n=1 Tax=Agaribacillus aureus TaxID=3051825 RepID=A0ABT8LD08_9BACT|nr:hypothetical protein [Fulvivirgaceae bacterium BMA12]